MFLTIIGTGIAVVAVIVTSNIGLKGDIESAKADLYRYIDKAEANLISRQDDFIDVQNKMDDKISGLVTSVEVTSTLLQDHRQQHSPTLAGGGGGSGGGGSGGDGRPSPFHEKILPQNANKLDLGQKIPPDTVGEE